MKNDVFQIRNDEFILKNYNNAKPFASFFPGIAGLWGKPMWVFYVNRGQAIACMGIKDKNGAMMEFIGANKAYRHTTLHGFRTFLKIKKEDKTFFYEPFKSHGDNNDIEQNMRITSYSIELNEINKGSGLDISVKYFNIPGAGIPALARILKIKNISRKRQTIDCLDGLPMIIPFGTSNDLLKNMSVLGEAWFGGIDLLGKNRVPVYKLQVEPVDRPEIVRINSANFYVGSYKTSSGKTVYPRFITEPSLIFGQVNDFTVPAEFIKNKKIRALPDESAKNKTPSAMGYFSISIDSDDFIEYNSIVGNGETINDISLFLKDFNKKDYLIDKEEENRFVVKNIQNKILFKSDLFNFDNYCQQNYLDNLLRGGYPVMLGEGINKKVYYAYSRIHGDMEREYNDFVITPQYFSHGNGSYRDVNQNRRNDIFFNPEIKEESIIYFLSLIQLDGFNPLGIIGSKFNIVKREEFLRLFKNKKDKDKINEFTRDTFDLGLFFGFIEKENIHIFLKKNDFLNKLMSLCEKIDSAIPKDGYWSDHWHYNIDLIESFLSIYPEKLEYILLKQKIFTFYDNPNVVVPRKDKYVLFKDKPRQLNAVLWDEEKALRIENQIHDRYLVRINHGKGEVFRTTLLGKLLSLVANKYASLDPEGVGVELESERSNWNDALNGLPGLFGSSTSESLELKRLILFILDSLKMLNKPCDEKIWTAEEIIGFFVQLEIITKKQLTDHKFWDMTHTVKEKYWQKTKDGVSGKESSITFKKIQDILNLFLNRIEKGLKKAFDKKTGVINTYFENKVIKYNIVKEYGQVKKNSGNHICINPVKFKQKPLPLFLEGPVHYLRMGMNKDNALNFYSKVKKSGLYDKKLKMYKVNASLKDASIDIGRLKIFTRGWLENESVWMHMEYKYLLEILKNGLVDEYYKTAETALVALMDPEIYGRSIFENVSFIVSSAHPDTRLHGQGYISRLSGSTAEFISIWLLLTVGEKPFFIEDNQLCLGFKPLLKKEFFTKKKEKVINYLNTDIAKEYSPSDSKKLVEEIILPGNSVLIKFLGKTIIVYHNPKRRNTYGDNGVNIKKMSLTYFNEYFEEIEDDVLREPFSYDVRNGKIKKIDITLG